jgi:HAE1 family hydrophobic/amphiphilic exporter-1
MLDDLDLPPEARAARLKEIEEEKASAGKAAADGPRGVRVLLPKNFLAERQRDLLVSGEKPGCFFFLSTFLSYAVVLVLTIPTLVLGLSYRVGGTIAQALLKYPLLAFDAGFGRAKKGYPDLLARLLKRPYQVSLVACSLAAVAFYSIYLLGWELLPTVDQGEFRINLELPTGTPIEKTNRRIAEVEDRIRDVGFNQEIRSLFATVGNGASEGESSSEKAENIGEIHVALVDRDQRDVNDEKIITKSMEVLQTEVDLTARSSKPQLMSYKTPVEIEIEGTNLERLAEASAQVIKTIRDVPGLLELKSSMAEQNPEVNITIDRTRAASLGLSVSDVTDVIRRKVKGETATEFDLPDQQIDVVVALTESDRNSPERLKRLIIPSSKGDIQLDQVADIKRALGPATITRSENSRVALITANIHGRPLGDVVSDIEARLEGATLPAGTFWRITGQNEEMKRSLPSLYLALALAIALVYIVLAAQFESLLHPFVIMFCVPFSMIGFTAALIVTGQTINLFSLIGMLMMIGIAVNDAIVFVTTINLRRDEGMKRDEAVIESGRSRLRPILITSLTTIFGMVPMAIAFGPGAELRAPMAIAVIGGLMASTVLTLLVIPCLYLILDNILPRSYKPHAVHLETAESLAVREGLPGTDAPPETV